ncbi:glycosyltransferase WbuB [Variovorax sp. UMC13]|uniref:glycosyltransferase WbuB n=1 Tax=Variovorax sp. UMC13 TaxID=1862326 RepID=UPI001604053F|nr:glycosyltransferase WbuB [Variovorax sp. UMC13]MBB1600087.1 glycosyl transferase [Variovorax sp. UMC13]
MKLLVYGINFAPELTGIGKYSGEMVAWLSARGHEVRVITAPPYYPEWKVHAGYSATRYARETWHGAQVFRTPLWVPTKVNGTRRLLHLASFALASIPALLAQWRWKPDVIWMTEPPLFCTPAGLAFARLRSAKAWLHIQDYEVDAAFELGLLKGARLRSFVAGAERWLLGRFDRVSTISQRMLERASAKGVQATRLLSFPNWADISAIRPLAGPSPYRAELGIADDAVVALYAGNMGAKQGLELLADLALALRARTDIVFVFCGGGAGRDALMARCAGLDSVRFIDLQPVERLGDLLGLADVHLLPQRADAADLVMPSKLTGMLSSGRPVLAGARPETELGQVVAQCGRIVPPEDAAAFAEALLQLAADPALRRELGLRARRYAEERLDRDAVLARFERDLQDCIGRRVD